MATCGQSVALLRAPAKLFAYTQCVAARSCGPRRATGHFLASHHRLHRRADLLTGSSAGSALVNGTHASSDHFVAINLLVMVPSRRLTLLPLSFYQVCQRPRVCQRGCAQQAAAMGRRSRSRSRERDDRRSTRRRSRSRERSDKRRSGFSAEDPAQQVKHMVFRCLLLGCVLFRTLSALAASENIS